VSFEHRSEPRRRIAGRNPVLFVLGALACAAALAWTYWAFVRTSTGQFADESAWREANLAPVPRGAALDFLDRLPFFSVFIAAALVLLVALVRRRWRAAFTALGVVLAANLTTQVLKHLVLDRPDRGVQTLDFNSLPSGHTTLAASAAAAVLLVVSPRWRPFTAAVGGTYSVLAGAATFINLWHRPADVVAAFLSVGLWTVLGGLVVMRSGSHWNRWSGYGSHWAASRAWLTLSWLACGASLVLAVGLYVLARWGGDIGPASDIPLYFWAGVCLIISAGYGLYAALGALFSQQAALDRHAR
jgi:hypothetical protein